MNTASRNGTGGRVYGGDHKLIHCQDGTRATIGAARRLEHGVWRHPGSNGAVAHALVPPGGPVV